MWIIKDLSMLYFFVNKGIYCGDRRAVFDSTF